MDANLFTAYNYLSSAIAQAFAALCVATAVFFFHRKRDIEDFLNTLYEKLDKFIKEHKNLYEGPIPLRVTHTHEETLEMAKNISDRLQDQELKKDTQEEISKHHQASKIKDRSRKKTMYSVIFSSVAMTLGLIALLIGTLLCDFQKWIMMGIEIVVGLFALGYALYVIWGLMIKKVELKVPK